VCGRGVAVGFLSTFTSGAVREVRSILFNPKLFELNPKLLTRDFNVTALTKILWEDLKEFGFQRAESQNFSA